ncbi:MAG: hypothetical protein Kow00109_19930 [Acidobacteriota bacterium]
MDPWRTVLGVLVVFALLALLYWAAARWGGRLGVAGRPSGRRIQLLERLPLGDRRSLMLVQVDEVLLLLGATQQNISCLAKVAKETAELQVEEELGPDRVGAGEAASFKRIVENLLWARR